MNLFPLSVKLYHNVSERIVSVTTVEKREYRFTEKLVSLMPSPYLESNQQRQIFVECSHCGSSLPLNLTEKTYALISHSVLTDPERESFVRRFIVRRARFNFFLGILVLVIAVNTLGLALECLLSMIFRLDLSNHQIGLIVKFQIPLTFILGAVIGKTMQSKNLRTRFVFMELRKKPTDLEIEISRMKGVSIYRLITKVELPEKANLSGHGLCLGSENMVFTYQTTLKTDPGIKSEISKEFEKFVFSCEPKDIRGASSGIVFY